MLFLILNHWTESIKIAVRDLLTRLVRCVQKFLSVSLCVCQLLYTLLTGWTESNRMSGVFNFTSGSCQPLTSLGSWGGFIKFVCFTICSPYYILNVKTNVNPFCLVTYLYKWGVQKSINCQYVRYAVSCNLLNCKL